MADQYVSVGGYPVPESVRPEFLSAYHKTERTAEHLKTLKSLIEPWRNGDGYELVTERDPQTGQKTVHFRFGSLPHRWSTIIGDSVQGLRNSLDNMVFGIAEANAGRPLTEREAKDLSLPIYGSEPLTDAEADRKLIHVPAEIKDFIRSEAIQPHHQWDPDQHVHIMWMLHKLANIDKHRTMHLGVVQMRAARARPPEGERSLRVKELVMEPPGTLLKNEAPIAWYTPQEGFEGDVEFDLALDVVFKDAGPAQHKSVLGILDDLNDYVFNNVILEIAARYERVINPT